MKSIYTKIALFCLCFFAIGSVSAQEIIPIVMTDYYQQELFINPAVTGSHDFVSATVSLRKRWLGIDGSPGVQRLQVHSPFANNKMGLGLQLQRESYGVTNHFNFGGSYAYHIDLERGRLSFGLRGTAVTFQQNLADVSTIEPDPQFSFNSGTKWGFNFGVGAYYTSNKFYAGLSLPNMFDNTMNQHDGFKMMNKFDLSQMPVYFASGYVFNMQEDIKCRLKPSVVLGYAADYHFVYNVGVTAFFYDKCWVGVNLKYRNEAGANLGVRLFDLMSFNYASTYGYNMPYTYRGFTHEININIQLGAKKSDEGKTRVETPMVYF